MIMPEGQLMPSAEGGVELLGRIKSIKPVIMSKLWLFSVIELQLGDAEILRQSRETFLKSRCQYAMKGIFAISLAAFLF